MMRQAYTHKPITCYLLKTPQKQVESETTTTIVALKSAAISCCQSFHSFSSRWAWHVLVFSLRLLVRSRQHSRQTYRMEAPIPTLNTYRSTQAQPSLLSWTLWSMDLLSGSETACDTAGMVFQAQVTTTRAKTRSKLAVCLSRFLEVSYSLQAW